MKEVSKDEKKAFMKTLIPWLILIVVLLILNLTLTFVPSLKDIKTREKDVIEMERNSYVRTINEY